MFTAVVCWFVYFWSLFLYIALVCWFLYFISVWVCSVFAGLFTMGRNCVGCNMIQGQFSCYTLTPDKEMSNPKFYVTDLLADTEDNIVKLRKIWPTSIRFVLLKNSTDFSLFEVYWSGRIFACIKLSKTLIVVKLLMCWKLSNIFPLHCPLTGISVRKGNSMWNIN